MAFQSTTVCNLCPRTFTAPHFTLSMDVLMYRVAGIKRKVMFLALLADGLDLSCQ